MLRLTLKWRSGRLSYPSPNDLKTEEIRWMVTYRTLILAVSDTQTLTTIAYGLDFWLIQKCSMSAYHYVIAINICLISCANFVLSLSLVREYWKAPASALLRVVGIAVIFGYLLKLLIYQGSRKDFPEYQPPLGMTSSALLLPATCFLDSEFADFYRSYTEAQKQTIGYPMKPWQFEELVIYVFNFVGLIAGLGRTLWQLQWDRHHRGSTRTYTRWQSLGIAFYKVQAVIVFLAVNVGAFVRIYSLKTWVNQSGWIKPGRTNNPENDWLAISQILPLILLATAFVAVSDQWTLKWYAQAQGQDGQKSNSSHGLLDFRHSTPAYSQHQQGSFVQDRVTSTPPRKVVHRDPGLRSTDQDYDSGRW
ncbi:uncharacterized protein KY384_001251 [Bacidia gigantensis]|uniref:uncharacterized protein n=1 Tax=Bacidia gigantensis TaxID=2732470 RepID=UPI001D053D3E|nr:uncharacterized protein KY384_001251 [Bacidia gigantensis]KAG8534406.1 hypothetical protein KY384_001251 [Bacidia gigantensis]